MKKEDIRFTCVWKVNKSIVVADTIEDAIALYKANYDFPYNDIDIIEKLTLGGYTDDNIALICDKSSD